MMARDLWRKFEDSMQAPNISLSKLMAEVGYAEDRAIHTVLISNRGFTPAGAITRVFCLLRNGNKNVYVASTIPMYLRALNTITGTEITSGPSMRPGVRNEKHIRCVKMSSNTRGHDTEEQLVHHVMRHL